MAETIIDGASVLALGDERPWSRPVSSLSRDVSAKHWPGELRRCTSRSNELAARHVGADFCDGRRCRALPPRGASANLAPVPPSSSCRHTTFVLARPEVKRRCRACHLVLSAEELGDSYCPECYEARGERSYDFEDVPDESGGKARYFCESCGASVE